MTRLSAKEIQVIGNNCHSLNNQELADALGVNKSTIVYHLGKFLTDEEREARRLRNTRKGLKKRTESYKFSDKYLKIIKQHSGLVYSFELKRVLEDNGLKKMGRSKFELLLNETDFVSKKEIPDQRFFLDGNPENLDFKNIILVSRDIYNWLYHNNLLNLKNEALLTAIELAKYKTTVNRMVKEETAIRSD